MLQSFGEVEASRSRRTSIGSSAMAYKAEPDQIRQSLIRMLLGFIF